MLYVLDKSMFSKLLPSKPQQPVVGIKRRSMLPKSVVFAMKISITNCSKYQKAGERKYFDDVI